MSQEKQEGPYASKVIGLKWERDKPKKKLDELIGYLGDPPVLAKEPRGIAIWYGENIQEKIIKGEDGTDFGTNCFDEIIIRDENIKHMCPAEHSDFIYSCVLVPIAPSKLPEILSISGSVNYDPLKKSLCARCGSIEANIATLKLAVDLIIGEEVNQHIPKTKRTEEGTLKYQNISEVHTHGVYGQMISATIDPNFTKEIYGILCQNLDRIRNSPGYKGIMEREYWPAAFSEECAKPEESLCPSAWEKWGEEPWSALKKTLGFGETEPVTETDNSVMKGGSRFYGRHFGVEFY